MEQDLDIVKEVLDPSFRTGMSEKTGKPWSIKKIALNSGKEAQTFDDVEAGDTVKMTYNDQYKSWNASKPRKADGQHDEVMKALREVYKQNSQILAIIHEFGDKTRPQTDSSTNESDAPW